MKRVLITPLDWGLGHATRSIPVIRELQRQGCDVLIAGAGDSLDLLKREFRDVPSTALPGYEPRYPAHRSMAVIMARQLPRFIRVISAEHQAVEKIVKAEGIGLLISDNRYGCWSEHVPSVLITHQSNILMPRRFGFLGGVVRRATEQLLNRFDMCWIPDFPEGHSLAGDLIAFGKLRIPEVRYIGWLSRFQRRPAEHDQMYDVLAVFSGPEPQRTVLERKVLPQLQSSGLRFRMVRGLPTASTEENETVINFLESKDLQDHIESSGLIIARSGYSTVMDLQALGKKAIFIPTPGQTEQEYLAARLMDKGIAFSMPQDEFNLSTALIKSKNYSGFKPSEKNTLLAKAVHELIIKNQAARSAEDKQIKPNTH